MAQGQRVFAQHCASCHGLNGRPHRGTAGEYGPNFDDVAIRDEAYVVLRIEHGGYGMQSFSDVIPEAGKRALAKFIVTVSGRDVPDADQVDDAQLAAGRDVFDSACRACHRLEGRGATAKDVTFLGTDFDIVRPGPGRIRHMIEHGDWWMPSLRRTVSSKEIEAVSVYIAKVAGGGARQGESDESDRAAENTR